MARVKTSKPPRDQSGDGPQEQDGRAGAESSPPVSKADAARAALADGIESPRAAVAFIRRRFGIEMDPQHFSAFKSQVRKKEREAEPQPAAKSRSRAADGYLAPPPSPKAGGAGPGAGEPDLLAVMEAMKPLIAQYGPDKVKRIVDLLG